jgi:ATP-binding cassette subfamily B protein
MGLLRPHRRALWLGLLAIAGESIADILQPWPLKVVLDNVIASKSQHGWLTRTIHHSIGTNAMRILLAACVAVMVIALMARSG